MRFLGARGGSDNINRVAVVRRGRRRHNKQSYARKEKMDEGYLKRENGEITFGHEQNRFFKLRSLKIKVSKSTESLQQLSRTLKNNSKNFLSLEVCFSL